MVVTRRTKLLSVASRILCFLGGPIKKRQIRRAKAAQRFHRRVEGMLAHPDRYCVMSPEQAVKLEETRDVLRRSFGYGPALCRALAVWSVENELCVKKQPDGSYLFALQDDFDSETTP